jgi:hypothetical protein
MESQLISGAKSAVSLNTQSKFEAQTARIQKALDNLQEAVQNTIRQFSPVIGPDDSAEICSEKSCPRPPLSDFESFVESVEQKTNAATGSLNNICGRATV